MYTKGGFALGFKTKETSRLNVHVGQEHNCGPPRSSHKGPLPRYGKMEWHHNVASIPGQSLGVLSGCVVSAGLVVIWVHSAIEFSICAQFKNK